MFWFLHRWFTNEPVDLGGLCEREVKQAIENAIDTVDPRMRLVGGYENKLRSAVVEALLHARELIYDIPGPLHINRRAFSADPQVHALFSSAEQLEQTFGHCDEVRRFRKTPREPDQNHCYALMLMTMKETRKPGFALRGDMVQGDVMQNVIHFTGHQLVKISASEDQVRTELRQRAFRQMLLAVNQKVADQTSRTAELKRAQVRLKRELEHQAGGSPALARQLAEVERELTALSGQLAHLKDYLDLTVEVLTNPEDHCGLERCDIAMSRSGVRLAQGSEEGHTVSVADIRIGDSQRVGILVRYPIDELIEARTHPHFSSLYGI